jgi:glycopeptide antibiotics resistance protein
MLNQMTRPSYGPPASSWSNRILLLATAGILFLTMYPFRFHFHVLPHGASPFLLGSSGKGGGIADAFLNVLLFVPFGFGLAGKLRERGESSGFLLVAALACGALFSYAIEFLQLYIPERDSGWEDVFTNGLGSLIGSILYLVAGAFVVRTLTTTERHLAVLLTARRIALALLVYFCFWFVLAAALQKQSRLSNWKPDAILILGNDASGRNPWRGQIQMLQIWDHALNNAANAAPDPLDVPIINYDFASLPDPVAQVAPKLFWIPTTPDRAGGPGLDFDGKSWLSTNTNAGDMAESLRQTNQFTIHLVCSAVDLADAWGRIVYISDSSGVADVMIRQENTSLGFWFRTPLASKHTQLIWSFPGVFNDHRQRDILYSYDGSNLALRVDGQKQRLTFKLGPGSVLARIVRRVKPAELEGYSLIFYAMAFWVGGALLGFSAPYRSSRPNIAVLFFSLLAFCAAAMTLEFILRWVSGRVFSSGNVALSVALGIAGFLWSIVDNDFRGSEPDRAR